MALVKFINLSYYKWRESPSGKKKKKQVRLETLELEQGDPSPK